MRTSSTFVLILLLLGACHNDAVRATADAVPPASASLSAAPSSAATASASAAPAPVSPAVDLARPHACARRGPYDAGPVHEAVPAIDGDALARGKPVELRRGVADVSLVGVAKTFDAAVIGDWLCGFNLDNCVDKVALQLAPPAGARSIELDVGADGKVADVRPADGQPFAELRCWEKFLLHHSVAGVTGAGAIRIAVDTGHVHAGTITVGPIDATGGYPADLVRSVIASRADSIRFCYQLTTPFAKGSATLVATLDDGTVSDVEAKAGTMSDSRVLYCLKNNLQYGKTFPPSPKGPGKVTVKVPLDVRLVPFST